MVIRHSVRLAILSAFLLMDTANAQTFGRAIPVGDGPSQLATADLDRDGISDLVTVNFSSDDISIFLGNGDLSFRELASIRGSDPPQMVFIADLNSDSDLDLVTANGASFSVFLGTGDGSFQAARNRATSEGSLIVAEDLNADSVPDLVTANRFAVNVMLGRGDGSFEPEISFPADDVLSLGVADFDQDGFPDLVMSQRGNTPVVARLGNGDGSFRSPVQVPAEADASLVPILPISIGDFSGDGLDDLAIMSIPIDFRNPQLQIEVLLGNGDASFRLGSISAIPLGLPLNAAPIEIADIDGDGFQDLAVSDGHAIAVLRGKGDGTFYAARTFTAGGLPVSIVAAHLNNDAASDLMVANFLSDDVSLLVSNGDGTLQAPTYYLIGDNRIFNVRSVATGDFNGDRFPDLVTGGREITLVTNAGDGTFGSPEVVLGNLGTAVVTASDFDDDGFEDVLVIGSSRPLHLLFGDGAGGFELVISEVDTAALGDIWRISTADINDDAVPDIIGGSGFLLGNGDGSFREGGSVEGDALVVDDLDADGFVDLVSVRGDNRGNQDVLAQFGAGNGVFEAPVVIPAGPFQNRTSSPSGRSVTVVDLNGDEIPDLVTTRFEDAPLFFDNVSVMFGNGDRTFQAPSFLYAGFSPITVEAADFDGNGTQDLVFMSDLLIDARGAEAMNEVVVMLGNGDGSFRDAVAYHTVSGVEHVKIADFDRDGSTDLVTSNRLPSGVTVLLNLTGPLRPELRLRPAGRGATPFNPRSRGVLPVTILGSEDFDVAEIDPSTLAFGPEGAGLQGRRGRTRDVDGDGDLDLVLHFWMRDAGLGPADTQACVTGELLDGTPFEACAALQRVGAGARRAR